jgi:sulfonate transport system permease protein
MTLTSCVFSRAIYRRDMTASNPLAPALAPQAISTEQITPHHRSRHAVPRPIRRLLGIAIVLGAWQLLSSAGVIPQTIVGSPAAVWDQAMTLIGNGELGSAIAASLARVGLGLLFGGAAGIGLALLSGLSRIGEDVVDAPVQMLRTVPFVGIIPLLIIWLGVGQTPKVALIALGVTFPLYINLTAGIRAVDPTLIEAGRAMGLRRLGLIGHVILPSALPQLLTGLRFALGVAWLALIFAEQISATNGLGYLMSSAQELLQSNVIVVCLIVYAMFGLAADAIVRGLERLLLNWRPRPAGGA